MNTLALMIVSALITIFFVFVITHARRTIPYVYCSAKISAWEARSIPEARLLEFADAARVVNILSGLDDTDYGPHLVDVPRVEEVDVVAVERALKASLSVRYQELLQMVPKEGRGAIARLIQRIDLWNLKTLLAAIHNKVPKEERMREMIPSPTSPPSRLELLAAAESFEELLKYIEGTEYFDVISAALEDYKKRGLIALTSALDKHYYSSLWTEVLRKKAQRSVLRAVVGYEIDAVNIKLILRLKKEGIPPDEIDKYVIRPSCELSDEMLRSMILADDVPSSIDVISHTSYGPILSGALPQFEATGSLLAMEKALDEGQLKICKWMSIVKLLSLAPVLAHVYAKEAEIRNLRTIMRLKVDKVEPEKIKEMLVRVPKIEL
ncbi:MAG: V-type ATPase subunit [Candidatus Hodarchaeaceae archaeon]|nr:V-type ATPase subunit [Candidatus Hodarchaeaceae archaeon]